MARDSSGSTTTIIIVVASVVILGGCLGISAIVGLGVLFLGLAPGPVAMAPPPVNAVTVEKAIPPQIVEAQAERPDRFELLPTPADPPPAPKVVAKPLILPPLPAALPIQPSPITSDTSFKLPGEAGAIRLAGGGRFLLIHLPKLRKVALFDCNSAKIERYLDLAEDDVRIAGGMNHAVVLLPGQGLLQRYNLLTGKRELSSKIDLKGKRLEAFSLGHASAGPLLICTEGVGGKLYDLEQFKELPLPEQQGRFGGSFVKTLQSGNFWASATGRVFGHSGNYGMPNGVNSYVYEAGDYVHYHEHKGSWYVLPGPDDRHLYVGGHGVISTTVKTVPNVAYSELSSSGFAAHYYVPAAHGPFYLHGQMIDFHIGQPSEPAVTNGSLRLFMLGSKEPLKVFTNVGLPAYDDWSAYRQVGLENLVQLIPKAKLLIVLPKNRDALRLIPVDLEQLLQISGRSYFYITSDSPGSFAPGSTWRHRVTVQAKSPVTFKLESAPPGMTITPQGELSWLVPVDFQPERVDVILTMKDSDSQEGFHTLTLVRK